MKKKNKGFLVEIDPPIILLLLAIILFISCFFISSCAKDIVKDCPLIKVENPRANLGTETEAGFSYRDTDGSHRMQLINISYLTVAIRDDKKNYTSLQITLRLNVANEEIDSYNNRYVLLVTSENEKEAWSSWIQQWTEFKPLPLYPPGHEPKLQKSEKE